MRCPPVLGLVLVGALVPFSSSGRAADDRPVPVDALGDPLPERALARLGTVRLRHGHVVEALAFSPDGKKLASGGHDFGLSVWDVKTGKELLSVPGPKERANPFVAGRTVSCVAFSPDGKLLAAGRNDLTLRLYDLATAKEVRRFDGLRGVPLGLAFSPDGKALASTGGDRVVRLWDVATGGLLHVVEDRQAAFTSLAYAPDGKALVGGGWAVLRVWDADTVKEKLNLAGHTGNVRHVGFSPDGKSLFSAADDGTARAWDLATGKEVGKGAPPGPARSTCAACTPDGRIAAVARTDGSLWLGELTTGQAKGAAVPLPERVVSLVFSPDGKLLASGDVGGGIHLWDVATRKEVRPVAVHTAGAWSACFGPDGKTVLAGYNDRAVRAWDAASGRLLREFPQVAGSGRLVAFSADGRRVATVTPDARLRFWDTVTGKDVLTPDDDSPVVRGPLAVSADGTLVAADAHATQLVDTATGEKRICGTGLRGGLHSVALSTDAKLLAATNNADGISLCDTGGGKERLLIRDGAAGILSLAFSPDGALLAGGDQNGGARLWHVKSGAALLHLAGNPGYVMAVAFSSDGRLLATGSWARVSLWEIASGKERLRLGGHRGDVGALAFNRDGRRLVSGSSDGTLLVWDVTGRLKDGQLTSAELTGEQVEGAWADLLAPDAAKAHAAVWSLVAAPKEVVPFLAERLRPAAATDDATIRKLIAQLDDDVLEVRDRATAELAKLGPAAESALHKVLESGPTAEVRLRARQILDKLRPSQASPEELREARSVEVLEQIGDAEAKKVLQELAKGAAGARLTQQARAALDRLGER